MGKLRGSAQFGLTQEQATTIAGKMLGIQNVYLTPDGVLETESDNDNENENDE